jgi:transcriptional regulator with XRE-family HTH domain
MSPTAQQGIWRNTGVMAEAARTDDRPAWAHRIRRERGARGWSQAAAVKALRAHAGSELATDATLIRNWKRWEAGEVKPDDFYAPLIARTFGTVTAAFFGPDRSPSADVALLAGTGLDTLELVARIQASDVSHATLDALQITADRLCSEYPYAESAQLKVEGQAWLSRITGLLDRRLTLTQHRDVLALAGTVALLLGCVEYDMGLRQDSEATRRAALSLGAESGRADVMGWAQEMRAWFALTQGNYHGVIAAAEAGRSMAPNESVAVQLAAQQAKAWARMGDRRQVEVALNAGRQLLETLPYPENLDHHFVVDPAKFDFYAMDCYRILGESSLAELYANEVIRTSTDFDGTERKPMRAAEARITLGVAAAQQGDLGQAIALGNRALAAGRVSLPSLTMVGQDLAAVLRQKYPGEHETHEFIDRLHGLTA